MKSVWGAITMRNWGWKFQFSLSSLLWFTICCALLVSSVLMYRRMSKAERENEIMRKWEGYSKEDKPVFICVNSSEVTVDVVYHVTYMSRCGDNAIACNYSPDFIFRNRGPEEIRIHLPLIRAHYCIFNSTTFKHSLDSEWKQSKDIVLKKGESFTLAIRRKGMSSQFETPDLFEGKDSRDCGRWALVFGVPEGEDPDKYLVGTVLTNPIHWQNEIPKKDSKSK